MMAIILVLALSACGIKPDNVEPPSGKESSRFPHTYPHKEEIPVPQVAPETKPVQKTQVKEKDDRQYYTFRP